MANPWFEFKQFVVWHDKCGMKVGTDGVLLGAWADVAKVEDALDIGAGTGLIALMIAQRMSTGKIDAVEIEPDACRQTMENFNRSPWSARLNAYNLSFQKYAEICTKKYDLIVSNPPYFDSKLKASDVKRAIARHSDKLPISELVSVSSFLIKDKGRLTVILPIEMRSDYITELAKHSFCISRQTMVRPFPQKSPVRVLIEASKCKIDDKKMNELIIRDSAGGAYTNDFVWLTKDYYLAF
jgi:tRNA1Val (adenine37-N6)-methyltransferase